MNYQSRLLLLHVPVLTSDLILAVIILCLGSLCVSTDDSDTKSSIQYSFVNVCDI